MYALQISSISTAEPVSVDEVKTHLKIQTTAEDSLIDAYITAARQQCENVIKRSLVDTQWLLTIDDFYSSHIELPRPPLSTKSTEVIITYTDTTGGSTTVSDTAYTVMHQGEPGFVKLNYNEEWPTNVQDSAGSVQITYRSGYSTSTCPMAIKQWIKIRVGQMMEYREALTDREPQPIPRDFVDGLLDPYRVITIP